MMPKNVITKIKEVIENAEGDKKLEKPIKELFLQLCLEIYEQGFLDALDAVDYSVNKMRVKILE